MSHVKWATSLTWEEAFPINLNPCLEFAFQQQKRMGYKLVQWRNEIVSDVEHFVEELEEDQVSWLSSAPPHVREVCRQGTSKFAVKLLAFAHLLYLLEFLEWQDLVCELFWGFKLLGTYHPEVRGR